MKQDEFLQGTAKHLSEHIDTFYGEHMGFVLLVFPYDSHNADYISNSLRCEMIEVLRETADRIEANEVIPPTIGES